jgi:hypothetical protein
MVNPRFFAYRRLNIALWPSSAVAIVGQLQLLESKTGDGVIAARQGHHGYNNHMGAYTIPRSKSQKRSKTVNRGRHEANCKVCPHPKREDIEREWVAWGNTARISGGSTPTTKATALATPLK